MKKWFLGSLVVAGLLGFVAGCSVAYKPDVDIERANIKSDKSIHGSVKGEYNAK